MLFGHIKRLLFTLIIGLTVLVVATLSSVVYIGTGKPIQKVTTRNDLTFIPWRAIRLGWLNYTLFIGHQITADLKVQEGKLQDSVPDFSFLDLEKDLTSNNDIYSNVSKYTILNNGQVKYPYVYRTKISNNDYVVLVQQWTSDQSNVRFLLYVFPLKAAESFGLSEYINSLLKPGNKIVPIISYSDSDFCLSITNSDNIYCTWYMSQQAKILNSTQKWKESGIIPINLGNYIFRMQTTL